MSPERFNAFTALSLIAFAYAGGITQISGAVFAGLISAQALFPYALDRWFGLNGNWFLLFGGVLLLFTLIQNPEGVAGDFYKRTHKRPPLRRPERAPAVPAGRLAAPGAAARKADVARDATMLSVSDLSVSFGGVRALRGVTLDVRAGELVGLIGPNGAGKSTFLDAVGGFVASDGRVELDGRDIGRLPAYERSRRGLGRTWQSTELFHDLDIRENLLVAANQAADGPASRLSGATVRRRLRSVHPDRYAGRRRHSRSSVWNGPPTPFPTTSPRASASWSASPARSSATTG